MKIAIFTDTFTPDINGVAKNLERFKNYLAKNNIEYRIFAPKSSSKKYYANHVHNFISLPFFLYPECRIALPNMLHVKKELQRFQPDIIHVATPLNIGLCGLHYSKRLQIPIVGSYHTDFNKYLESYNLQFISKILWKYMRWFHRPLRRVFVPSNDTKEQLQKHGFTHLSIWPSGVDCSLFHPNVDTNSIREKYHIKENYILTYVGRIAAEKDVMLLLEIAKLLPEKIRNDVHWLIVGDGPLKKDLENISLPNMTLTGFLHGKDLADVYAAGDLFVFPSPSETFGNVVLESLACGTPVVCADAGGVRSVVEEGVTGMLCQEKNVLQFANAVTSLIEQEHLRREMGENGRRYALTQSWDTIFNNLLQEYDEVLEKRAYRELA